MGGFVDRTCNGLEYVWEAETAEERATVDEKLIEENASRLKSGNTT